MRKADVKSLIRHAETNLEEIRIKYRKSLDIEVIDPSLRIDVKNMMENLRSALDYIAHDIYEKIIHPQRIASGRSEIRKIHFPYGKDENSFKMSVMRNLPGLPTLSPPIFALLEHVQPHKFGNRWLYDFCTILNQNKHNRLSAHRRKFRLSYAIGPRGGSPVISALAGAITAPPGAIRIGGEPIFFDPNTGIPISSTGLDVQIYRWVNFIFEDTQTEVLPILELAIKEIDQLASKIYSII